MPTDFRPAARLAFLATLLLPAAGARAQDVTLTVDATHDRRVIPDAVYGVNDDVTAGGTVHRHGGNRMTGFNWENNASNAGSDYNQQSDNYLGYYAGIGTSQTPGAVLRAWLDADRAAGRQTIITLPLAGYVAADMNGPVSQGETAPSARWKQIVVEKPGGALSLTPDSTDGVVYLAEMVNFLVVNYHPATDGGVSAYNLDNEPALWPSTHPRIHPNATRYDELVSRHVPAATMVTRLDPGAQVYGPVLYGWEAYRSLQSAPDSGANNGTYGNFASYYLAQMKAASDTAGRRLLHRFDMHWYPEASGDNRIVFGSSPGTNNDIDARLQAPRSLWDPAYVEKSWITQYTTNGQGVQLLPRLQGNVDQWYPGTGLAITEYDYGATDHISGGVAQADVLGVFGDFGVAANFWPILGDSSYVAAAFRLYRNYDGAGARFGTVALNTTASDNALAGVHAARAAANKLTVVAVNRSRTQARTAQVQFTLPTGQTLSAVKAYALTPAGGAQVQPAAAPASLGANGFPVTLPAMSATLYEVQISAPAAAGYAAWQQAKFGADAANPAIAGDDADPDRDGVSNLLEYATNRNPLASDRIPVLAVTPGGSGSVQLQFNRRKGAADVQVTLQSSPTLAAGSWIDQDPAALNPTVTNLDSETDRWTVVLPLDNTGHRFYRLRVQR